MGTGEGGIIRRTVFSAPFVKQVICHLLILCRYKSIVQFDKSRLPCFSFKQVEILNKFQASSEGRLRGRGGAMDVPARSTGFRRSRFCWATIYASVMWNPRTPPFRLERGIHFLCKWKWVKSPVTGDKSEWCIPRPYFQHMVLPL